MALAAQGYRVTIITIAISTNLYQQDLSLIAAYSNINIHIVSDLYGPNSFTDRAIYKLGRSLKKYLNIESSLSLGYGAYKYFKACKAINASLYICHQELATYIGTKLMAHGYKVAFDFEDWYSEDLLLQARKERPLNLLRKAEHTALKDGSYCITTSKVLAGKLSETYSSKAPNVIYNVFPSRQDILQKTKDFTGTLKLFWFSQTIGLGRGLEQFISISAKLKKPLELHLLGNIHNAYRGQLISIMPVQHQLHFHPLVPENDLANKIALFDIGLALELDTPMSRNYTITNKFFQYIQAGLPVIASKTAGQKEGFEQFEPGFMLSQKPTDAEIVALEKWLEDPVELQAARIRTIEAAKAYNWDNESGKLLAFVKKTLDK
ncbi:glycosyltransferase family 4 protein [Inquilinus sp. KBS0705]|nr:glycosyltransferase family 4 protein [Inquilinus sp. KBS0705]